MFIFSSQAASAQRVATTVRATTSSNVLDATMLGVTGAAPWNITSDVRNECHSSQSHAIWESEGIHHCDTDPSDKDWGTTEGGDSCRGVFRGAQSGSLVKTTSAGATGSLVAPGQTISVTITWKPSDFGGYSPPETEDCVKIGSHISRRLSQTHKPGSARGTDHFSYVVPLDGTGGNEICDRATVLGPWENVEKSVILCYTVMGAEAPEVPNTLMLPIAAMLVLGGGLWIVRRRRHGLRI